MSIETDIDTALGALVDSRIYPNVFAQPQRRPEWPAIRRTIVSVVPPVDLCGDGGDDTDDLRIQLDIVVSEASGYTALKTLRGQVATAMAAFDPPAIRDGERYEFDEETRTHRCSMDYMIYPSSDDA